MRQAASSAEAIGLASGLATQAGEEAVVLVVGSVYLAGEVRAKVLADRAYEQQWG